MTWLTEYIWPAEAAHVGEDFVSLGSELALYEMISNGIGAFADMYFFPEITAKLVAERGMRALIGVPILNFPSNYAAGLHAYIDKAEALLDAYAQSDLVRVALAPHSCYAVSDEGLARVAKIAAARGCKVHTHAHESAGELAAHAKDYPGQGRPIERLVKHGLFNENLLAAHMTQLSDDEQALVARSGVSVAHCPESNMKLSSGVCPVNSLISKNVNVAIGTDGPASNDDLDMM